MTPLLQAFKALEVLSERKAALRSILSDLSPYEWRWLSSQMASRELRFDIIAALPLELVMIVFQHLPMDDVWRLQCVSKSWKVQLSSEHVVKSALAQWYSPNDPPLIGESEAATSHEWIQLKLKHMQAFRLGRPFSYAIHVDEYDFLRFDRLLGRRYSALHHETLAYVRGSRHSRDHSGTMVSTRNLRTGATRIYQVTAGEQIRCIALTEGFLAIAITTGFCNIVNLETERQHAYRLPSSYVVQMSGDKGFVAMVFLDKVGGGQMVIFDCRQETCTSWPFVLQPAEEVSDPESVSPQTAQFGVQLSSTNQVRTTDRNLTDTSDTPPPDALSMAEGLLVDASRSTIVIFSSRRDDEEGLSHTVSCICYTFDGRETSSDPLEISLGSPSVNLELGHHEICAVDNDGTYRVCSVLSGGSVALATVLFDAKLCRLYEADGVVEGHLGSVGRRYAWKDTVFALDSGPSHILQLRKVPEDWRMLRPRSTAHLVNEQRFSGIPTMPAAHHPDNAKHIKGNESYVVVFTYNGVAVYCFEQNVRMKDGIDRVEVFLPLVDRGKGPQRRQQQQSVEIVWLDGGRAH
ncbi:hypothetical protein LTR66_014103 [Elasticomyces elasticus]|nr:hypothetical protein LTR66_014103 [Elasticomyces elasticus]